MKILIKNYISLELDFEQRVTISNFQGMHEKTKDVRLKNHFGCMKLKKTANEGKYKHKTYRGITCSNFVI